MTTREFNFTVGPETSEQPSVGTPSDDTDLVTKGYADAHYVQGKLSYADATAIKAIGSSARTNGDLLLNRALNRIYRFDSASSATGDDITVIQPTSGTGRWLRQGSPNTTKGDMTVYGASGDERMPVGTDGYAVVADSTQSRGVKYSPIAGAGEINCCTSPSDATNWVASGAGVTIATSTTAADLPLEGIIPTTLKITGVSSTDYARFRFTMPDALLSRKLKIEWFQLVAGGYASGDFKVDLYYNAASNYGGAYTRVALSTDSSAVSAIPNLIGKFTTTFDDVAANLYYELRIVRTAGTGNLNLANVVIGPGIQPQGAVIQEWLSYVPTTQGLGTLASTNVYYRRVGSVLEVKGDLTTGTKTAAELQIGLPTGLTIASSIGPVAPTTVPVGKMYVDASSTVQGIIVATAGDAFVNIGYFNDGSSRDLLTTVNADDAWGAGAQRLAFEFSVPISQWVGSGTVNLAQNDVEYASNSSSTDASETTSFVYGPSGSTGVIATTNLSAARAKRVQFQTPMQSTDSTVLEYQPGGGTNPWIALTGIDGGTDLGNFQVQNAVSYGIRIDRVSGSTTQLDVVFGQYAWPSGATFGSAGVQWSTALASTRWRVKKFSQGQSVGFGAATSTQSGLVSTTTQTFGGRKNAGNSKVNVTLSGAQSISNGTTTKISFDTEAADTNNEFDSSTNYRFTPTNSGYYLAVLVVEMSSIGDGKAMQIYLRKNNSAVGQFYNDMKVGNTGGIVMCVTGVFSMNGTTDYLEAFCEQNSGGSTNASGGTSATRLIITELI